ncbi:hypothetical protein PTSG_01038 [Salpingoeca rosetta]|uniref:Uncharacterized protein n=1 Tax=Salpingoeca rosetta (strain ATCC 50818 / BSB-021) TaxID=946362 RepID=F2TY79_SALR5|nr:uncharacterized protein PTSG_01038 [Salpingoeca rosetta]EGD76338.1 hypothetical protein PTSG_01038 [Salpingoeca rosetta]|eukprot:XP_004998513.1 hypothetical protein PTSG_01038 [Salpingoeca rosetta]
MSSVGETAKAINDACHRSGGVYAQYSCKYVSWDDACRGTVGGGLSCWGANITDTYLKGRDGRSFFTVRSDNWNEKLGCISSDKIAVVVGNHVAGGDAELKPITLRSLLKNLGSYGAYCKVPEGTDLSNDELDQKVSIRFQTTFLPVPESDAKRDKVEFCTEAYNYNTRSDDDPRNLLVLGTTQGIAIQQDGRGAKKLMHHAVDPAGVAHKYWLEAERSDHAVGGPQKETQEEKEDAVARGKATAAVIGIPAMGTRFNALLTVQVPLKQRQLPRRAMLGCAMAESAMLCCATNAVDSFAMMAPPGAALFKKKAKKSAAMDLYSGGRGRGGRRARGCARAEPKLGVANAARVSRGTEAGVYQGLATKRLERDTSQHVTVTVVMYNTVAGGVPKVEDVRAAIDDMEALYKACHWTGRLADQGADFMKAELTVKDAMDIQHKVTHQPYTATSQPVANFDQFPTD